MKLILRNDKGTALVTVLIICAVMLIIGSSLMDFSLHDLKNNMESQNATYTYIGADSAIQQSFDTITQLFANPAYANSKNIVYKKGQVDADEEFATQIKSYISTDLNALLSDAPTGTSQISRKLDLGNSSNSATIEGYDVALINQVFQSPYMIITLGITAKVNYNPLGVSSQTKEVYAQKAFKVYVAKEFFLRGPVYTIGDFMTDNPSGTPGAVSVQGDVHVYGTSPDEYGNDDQDYYGGIIAQKASTIFIDGNAFSRSHIRTGGMNDNDAGARIDITKDAFAQSIQAFSDNSNILVYRNAYTYDDMEMNGQNSIIGVNGNYFGLSPGADYPDESSSIVNSSPIYNYTDDAQKSRIVVNGDVLINGSTILYTEDETHNKKITPKNSIEDASTAWLDDMPMFRDWDLSATTDYTQWIKDNGFDTTNRGQVNGYGNLFQIWSPFDISVPANVPANVATWVTNINSVRKIGSNTGLMPGSINGFCNNMMAANDRIYYKWKALEINKPNLLKGQYVLDNFDSAKNAGIPAWTNFWDAAINDSSATYYDKMHDNFALLNNMIKDEANIFITRAEYSTTDTTIKHPSNFAFSTTKDSLGFLKGSNAYFKTADRPVGAIGKYIYKVDPTDNNPNTWSNPKGSAVPYYVLYNDDAQTEINLNNITFNGIIFTNGKVTLSGNATVNGAVIAAGDGVDQTVSASDETGGFCKNVPSIQSNGSNLGKLYDGSYAAIYCTGQNNHINFPGAATGATMEECRDNLILNIFYDEGLYLQDIFK